MVEEIYKQYAKQVYTYALYLTREKDTAEELTQETFYRAIKNIKKFRGECTIGRWLCIITKNLYLKEMKKNKKNRSIPIESIDNIENIDYNLEEIVQNNQEKKWLYTEIQKLEKIEREIVLLRTIENFSFKVIGEIFGKSEGFARVKYYRAKKKIIKIKEEEKVEK